MLSVNEWLHFHETRDVVFCHACLKALENYILTSGDQHEPPVGMGLATAGKRLSHEKRSNGEICHCTVQQCEEFMSEQHSLEKKKNRSIVVIMLSDTRGI